LAVEWSATSLVTVSIVASVMHRILANRQRGERHLSGWHRPNQLKSAGCGVEAHRMAKTPAGVDRLAWAVAEAKPANIPRVRVVLDSPHASGWRRHVWNGVLCASQKWQSDCESLPWPIWPAVHRLPNQWPRLRWWHRRCPCRRAWSTISRSSPTRTYPRRPTTSLVSIL
jgi:hypothetical protein